MDATRLVLNTLWFVLHGWVLAPAYLLAGSWRACSSSPSRARLDLAVTTWSPLGGGVPSGKYRSGAEEGRAAGVVSRSTPRMGVPGRSWTPSASRTSRPGRGTGERL